MNIIHRSNFVLLLFVCLLITSCSQQKINPSRTEQPKPESAPESKPDAIPPADKDNQEEPKVQCPQRSDIYDVIDEGNKLSGEISSLRQTQSLANNSAQNEPVKKHLSAWLEHIQLLQKGNSLLLGANGTVVFPEIPLALENLALAAEWMRKSIESAESNGSRPSRLYLRAANDALIQSKKVLDKKIKLTRRAAVIKIPRYLRTAHLD